LQGNAPKEIHAILTDILGVMHHHMPQSKWMFPFKRDDFPPALRLVMDETKD